MIFYLHYDWWRLFVVNRTVWLWNTVQNMWDLINYSSDPTRLSCFSPHEVILSRDQSTKVKHTHAQTHTHSHSPMQWSGLSWRSWAAVFQNCLVGSWRQSVVCTDTGGRRAWACGRLLWSSSNEFLKKYAISFFFRY